MKSARAASALLLLALPLAALGQAGDRAAAAEARLEQRFAAADTNGDGRLTREEAQSGMPRVFRRFEAIDGEGKGYVTLDDIRAALLARLAQRRGVGGAAGVPDAP